ncbi:MAG: DUF4433 domain-containing protein [Planctomycetota bacterium]|nr:DUF4433 domain-containing protein [Planctomycetota bacterium]
MPEIPRHPKIYHITHINNLEGILKYGALWSDAKRIELELDYEKVAIPAIKKRRLEELEVKCHQGTKVGEYVPFYFCPRSIMLYILHMGNHPDISYREGQGPIVHLQADLMASIQWAEKHKVRWAFSDRNAGERIANFYNDVNKFNRVNWLAVAATDWRDTIIQEGKQAEFLVYKSFPWELVEKIGVHNNIVQQKVLEKLTGKNQSLVSIEPSWYY